MTQPITLVYPYYNNAGMLERHCQEWARYDPELKPFIRAIVVDDGSALTPARDHLSDPGFPVSVYRIVPNLIWNVAGARNLGMHQAPDGWCLLTDIDHLLTAEHVGHLMAMPLRSGRYYVPSRIWADGRPLHPHPNSYVLERSLYWKVGGCDEDFTGWWGAGEVVFRKMISHIARGETTKAFRLTHFGRDDVPDASTTEWGRRDSSYHWRKNRALVRKADGAPYRPTNPLRFEWEQVA